MSDFFHEDTDKWWDEAWNVIAECSNLDWLILTKRAERIAVCLFSDWREGYPTVGIAHVAELLGHTLDSNLSV
jgi:protein gp37